MELPYKVVAAKQAIKFISESDELPEEEVRSALEEVKNAIQTNLTSLAQNRAERLQYQQDQALAKKRRVAENMAEEAKVRLAAVEAEEKSRQQPQS
jgi:hypothetical protein